MKRLSRPGTSAGGSSGAAGDFCDCADERAQNNMLIPNATFASMIEIRIGMVLLQAEFYSKGSIRKLAINRMNRNLFFFLDTRRAP